MEPTPPDPAEVVARLEQAASRIRAAAVAPSESEGLQQPGQSELAGTPAEQRVPHDASAEASDPLAQARAELAEVRAQLVAAATELGALL